MKINELSGDSNVTNLFFQNGIISFVYEDYDSDRVFLIKLRCNSFMSEAVELKGTARIQALELANYLDVDEKSQRYISKADFGAQMEAARKGAHLALGKHRTEFRLLFRVTGDKLLLSVPILSLDQLEICEYFG